MGEYHSSAAEIARAVIAFILYVAQTLLNEIENCTDLKLLWLSDPTDHAKFLDNLIKGAETKTTCWLL